MALMPYSPIGGSNVMYRWPNSKTVCSSNSIIVNIVCMVLKTSKGTILIANLPTRIVSVIIHREDYVKVAFEVAAFAALFFPYGPWISIAIDATSEVVNFLQYRSKKSPTLPEVTTMHRPRFEMGPITPAVLRSQRAFLEADERGKQAEIEAKKPRPPMTEVDARKILELPEKGSIDLSLAEKNWKLMIKEFQESREIVSKSFKWFYEVRISKVNEAYEIICRMP